MHLFPLLTFISCFHLSVNSSPEFCESLVNTLNLRVGLGTPELTPTHCVAEQTGHLEVWHRGCSVLLEGDVIHWSGVQLRGVCSYRL